MSDQKLPTNRRSDKFNLTDNGRRLLSEFLGIPETTASQIPSAKNRNKEPKIDNKIVADQLKSLIDTYNSIFRMCCDALEVHTQQAQRNALRETIEELIDTSGKDDGTTSNGNVALIRLNGLINQFSGQLKKCYDALSEDTPQTERDELRNAIVGYLANK